MGIQDRKERLRALKAAWGGGGVVALRRELYADLAAPWITHL
jgi:hypothetical protein